MNKKFFIVAKFEFIKTIRKPSFWIVTLFFPLFIGFVSYLSGSSAQEAEENFRDISSEFEQVYIVDDADILKEDLLEEIYTVKESKEESLNEITEDGKLALLYIPTDYLENKEYEIYYQERESLLAGMSIQGLAQTLVYTNALYQVEDPILQVLLTTRPTPTTYSVTAEGDLIKDQIENYILPIFSLIVFFLAVFLSSNLMLDSVSSEKENRMIETILSIVDKRSLITGKLIGLIAIVLLQLILWVGLSLASYYIMTTQMDMILPIDLSQMDLSLLPINLFFIILGFLFFSAIMVGVGAVGTGASDSKNLSAIFILMAVFPMYLLQLFITDPNNTLARVLSYFPFTSFMVLLIRNSLGALSTEELLFGGLLTLIYVGLAIWLAIKLFEIGCVMYNRRPNLREIWGAIKAK